jgi:hypothetical protein
MAAAIASSDIALASGTTDGLPHDAPASPRSLPADNLPPFGMLDADGQLTPAPSDPASGLHESTTPGPSLFLALEAAQAARFGERERAADGVRLCRLQRTAEWLACGRRGTLKVGGQSMAGGPARRRTGGPNSPSKARGL